MKARNAFLLFVLVAAGCLFLANAQPAAAQDYMFCGACSCDDSCSTPCSFISKFVMGEPIYANSTCGQRTDNCAGECNGCGTVSCTNTITGGSGNDTLNGASTKDCIYGYAGNDTIDGNAGDDWVWAGGGTDTVYGDSGNDCMLGEDGNDHLDGQSGSADVADGGNGTDTCTAETEASCEI